LITPVSAASRLKGATPVLVPESEQEVMKRIEATAIMVNETFV